jgi:hypothetical protein
MVVRVHLASAWTRAERVTQAARCGGQARDFNVCQFISPELELHSASASLAHSFGGRIPDSGKGILNQNAGDPLSSAQILRENPSRTTPGG